MLRVLKAFFPALLVAYCFASLLATAHVMGQLRGMGVAVSATTQMQASWHDLLGMTTSYLLLLTVAFLIALPVAAGLSRLFRGWRIPLFLAAGGISILVLHLLLSALLQITPVAAARSPLGLAGQCLAGITGAAVYLWLSGAWRPRADDR